MASLPKDTTVLVATGEAAKFFVQDNNATDVSLSFSSEEKPGDFADQGPSGKTPPEMGPAEQLEATFSKVLSDHLFHMAHSGKFSSLVLIADPGTLGEMRPLLHDEVTDKIVLELDKTLINSPVSDIEKSISAALK